MSQEATDARKEQRNLTRFHGEAAASAVEDAAVGYQSPSVIAVGANAQTVSLLATLVNLCLSLISFKAPGIIKKIGVTKRGSIVLAISNVMTWVPLVIVFFLAHLGITPTWVAVLWLINIMPGMLLSFQKDNWLSDIIPGRMQGKYLGQRLAIKSLFYLAAFFMFGFLMDSMGENNLLSFGLVFMIATGATVIYSVIYSKMHDPKKVMAPIQETAPKAKFGLFDYVGDLKEKKLDKFVLFTALINISIGLSAPLFAVYMLEEQHFSYLSYTIIISVEFLARVISGPFWGKFADKEGNIKVLKIVSRIIPALPICWLFSSSIGYLAFIQILSGICWGAFDLATQSYLYKVAPPAKKLNYIVYTRSLMLFSVAMGGLVGSFLVKYVFEIFGSKLLTVFMISGFMRAVIVMFLMPKLIDLAVSYGLPYASRIKLALTKKSAMSTHGLFYHKHEPEEVAVPSNVIEGKLHKRNPAMEQRLIETQAAKRQLIALTETVKTGKKRNWAMEAAAMQEAANPEPSDNIPDLENVVRRNWVVKDKAEIAKKETTPPAEIKPMRRPWFGDSEILENYRVKVPVTAAAGINFCSDKSTGRGGLFYNDAGWARYKEESLQAVIKEKQASKAAINSRSVFIESSYPWRNTY
jgi:hypothetical protein